jgi:hypothetical protein
MRQITSGSNRSLAKAGCGCSHCSALLDLEFSGSRLRLLGFGKHPAEIIKELDGKKAIIRAVSIGDGMDRCGAERMVYNLDMTSS